MRNSMEITVKYQFVHMLLMQAAASGITIVFGLVAFWYFLNISVAKEILSVVFMGVNFAVLYVTAKKFALLDYKTYTPLKPNKIKGVLFGVFISAVTLVLMLIFMFVWKNFSTETGIHGVLPTAVNALFYCWTFPYNGIMGLSYGKFMIYSVVVMLALPIAATGLGYLAGSKKLDISDKLDGFVYEKE